MQGLQGLNHLQRFQGSLFRLCLLRLCTGFLSSAAAPSSSAGTRARMSGKDSYSAFVSSSSNGPVLTASPCCIQIYRCGDKYMM